MNHFAAIGSSFYTILYPGLNIGLSDWYPKSALPKFFKCYSYSFYRVYVLVRIRIRIYKRFLQDRNVNIYVLSAFFIIIFILPQEFLLEAPFLHS